MRAARSVLRQPASGVWVLLVVATIVSWWLGTDHGIHGEDAAGAIVLMVAFAKVRVVGFFFMELQHAPRPLRAAFDAWCAVVATALVWLLLGA